MSLQRSFLIICFQSTRWKTQGGIVKLIWRERNSIDSMTNIGGKPNFFELLAPDAYDPHNLNKMQPLEDNH